MPAFIHTKVALRKHTYRDEQSQLTMVYEMPYNVFCRLSE